MFVKIIRGFRSVSFIAHACIYAICFVYFYTITLCNTKRIQIFKFKKSQKIPSTLILCELFSSIYVLFIEQHSVICASESSPNTAVNTRGRNVACFVFGSTQHSFTHMHPPNHPHWENAKEEADPHMIIPWTDADFFSFFDFHIKSPCFSTNKCDISKPLHTHTPDSHMFYLDFDSFMNMDIADVSLSVNSWLILCEVWKKISDPSLSLGLLMPCSCIWSLLPVILYIQLLIFVL